MAPWYNKSIRKRTGEFAYNIMSIDKFDYAEPSCPLSGGKEFYYPETAQSETIPVRRVIDKLDEYFAENDLDGAGRLLEYWQKEAVSLCDKRGELSVVNELLGYYRKTGNAEKSAKTVERANALLSELSLLDTVSGATVILNIATNHKAFGNAQKALPLYLSVLATYQKELTVDDVKFGGLYNNFALSLADCGKYDIAEEYFNKALTIMEKQQNGLPDCAVTYVNMAVMYRKIDALDDGRVDKALQNALDCLDDKSTLKDGYYAFVCDKCAAAFSECGWFLAADDLKARARRIYERT